jgi:1-deoxy-D-xylulose-5-phosphate synthase
LVVGSGPLLEDLVAVITELSSSGGPNLALLDLRCVKPLDTEYLTLMAARYPLWLSVEENVLMGGIGSALLEFISDHNLNVNLKRMGLPNQFVTHGDRKSLLREIGLSRDDLKSACLDGFTGKRERLHGRSRSARVGR